MAFISLDSIDDMLLGNLAEKIQLSPTEYRRIVEHYRGLAAFVDRKDSPLHGMVGDVYPQGSMAIGATISSKLDNDEYDADAVIELLITANNPPRLVLDELFKALNAGEYMGRVHRQTRCVTVDYDNTHVDFTPMCPLFKLPNSGFGQARTGQIFHSKPEEPPEKDHVVVGNPWGFGQHFREQIGGDFYGTRAMLLEKADVTPIPDQVEVDDKPVALLAYQLLKRNRNVRYDDRRDIRRPPSVMLASMILRAQPRSRRLLDVLIAQANVVRRELQAVAQFGEKIVEMNPKCPVDNFADRWPESLEYQQLYIDDLGHLINELQRLPTVKDVPAKVKILTGLFGERPAVSAVEAVDKYLNESVEGRTLGHKLGLGGVVLNGGPAIARSTAPTRPNTFYGEER